MKIFNNIIVGSGPIGTHVFKKLKKDSLIITGKTEKKIKSTNIHPKIRLGVDRNTSKITDLIYSKKKQIFFIYIC